MTKPKGNPTLSARHLFDGGVPATPAPSKFCFVISTIGDPGTEARKVADEVLDELIRPALEPLGYTVTRADQDKTPGVITESMISALIAADLVVAELSDLNPNVMYELGIRHAFAKPVIQMMTHGTKLPFDIQGQNTITYDRRLAGRAKCIDDLASANAAIGENGRVGNPVKQAVDLSTLAKSTTPEIAQLAQMVGELLERVPPRASIPHVDELQMRMMSALDLGRIALGDHPSRRVMHIAQLSGGRLVFELGDRVTKARRSVPLPLHVSIALSNGEAAALSQVGAMLRKAADDEAYWRDAAPENDNSTIGGTQPGGAK